MARLKFIQEFKSLALFRLDDDVAGTQAPATTPYRLEDRVSVGTFRDKAIFNHEQVIDQLDMGAKIEGRKITFSFLDGPLTNQPGSTPGEFAGFSELSENQKTATRQAMELWDELIAVRIEEKRGNGAGAADILVGNTTTGPEVAWAYYPSEDGNPQTPQSYIWIADPEVQLANYGLSYGDQGLYTMVHEIGHSLGLSHPGDYNNGADNDGDGQPDPITYATSAVYAQDSQQYSAMSYFAEDEVGGWAVDVSRIVLSNPQTPMLHDILAIQEKYGADPTTRAGDTVYFANSNACNPIYDLAENPFPYLCVYDAGGNDTFDFSTANTGVFLDLRAGSFSSASRGYLSLAEANAAIAEANAQSADGQGTRQPFTAESYAGWVEFVTSMGPSRIENDTDVSGINAPTHRNISIAYNTVIENAIGGAARDYLVGNDVANLLKGNGGGDVLNGLGGNDVLWGGAGADEFRFFADSGIDTILDFLSGTDTISLAEIDADTFAEGDQAFSFIPGRTFSHTAGELLSYSILGANFLAGDADGDGLADFVIGVGGSSILQSDLFL